MKHLILMPLALALIGSLPAPAQQNSDPTLVQVNQTKISKDEVSAALGGATNPEMAERMLRDPNTRKTVVEGQVNNEILKQAALKSGLQNSDEYKNALKIFKRQALANILIEKKISPQITPQNKRQFYDKNKIMFRSDEVMVHHILHPDPKQAQRLADAARKQGTDFQKLAEQYSKDPQAKKNRGVLPFFTFGQMPEAFSREAFSNKVGAIVGPVKTPLGYHVIKIIERKPGKLLSYEEVDAQVGAALKAKLSEALLNKLKRQAKITWPKDRS